jgi:cyclic pyranopterin phosphate synthase
MELQRVGTGDDAAMPAAGPFGREAEMQPRRRFAGAEPEPEGFAFSLSQRGFGIRIHPFASHIIQAPVFQPYGRSGSRALMGKVDLPFRGRLQMRKALEGQPGCAAMRFRIPLVQGSGSEKTGDGGQHEGPQNHPHGMLEAAVGVLENEILFQIEAIAHPLEDTLWGGASQSRRQRPAGGKIYLLPRMRLLDPHQRHIHKLRLQLTDACNFRCFYCMPHGTRFLPPAEFLAPGEIESVCGVLADLGIDEIRVTGGEPTVRAEFDDIMRRLSRIAWKKFGLTSNGFLLEPKLPMLRDLGCAHLNISLDSLDENKFRDITGSDRFKTVLGCVLEAKAMGFDVKVNAIVFRGMNDGELPAFARFSEEHGVEVRFLELMKVGPAASDYDGLFVPAAEMMEILGRTGEAPLIPRDAEKDSTARLFRTARGGRLGFIASETLPFCGTCSRLRLSARGKLRSCLFSDTGVDLRGRDPLDYPEILNEVMALKPAGRLPRILQPMNQIGG